MNSRQRNILFGGALVAGSVAGAFYLFSKNKEKTVTKPVNEISRELVIKILKQIQREMFTLLSNISMSASQIKEQSRGRVENAEIKEFLFHKNPATKEQMKNITEKIYDKYGIEERDLKYACEVTFKDDKEIRQLLNEAKTSFDKAFLGISLDLRTEIPAMLTPELTLNIHRKIMKETLYKIHNYLQSLRQKGTAISYNNPEVLMGLQNLKLEELRIKVFTDEGLDAFEESPLKIFQFATQKYATENLNGFTQKFQKLDMQNQKITEAVMKGLPETLALIDNLGAHLDVNAEEVVQKIQASKKEKEDQEANLSKEEPSLRDSEHFVELKRQLSSKIKTNLEESAFPQDLVDSAMSTLLKVLQNLEKPESLRNSQIQEAETKEEAKEEEEKPVVVETNAEATQEVKEEVNAEVPVEVSTVVTEEKPQEVAENVEQEEKPVESEAREEAAEENQE